MCNWKSDGTKQGVWQSLRRLSLQNLLGSSQVSEMILRSFLKHVVNVLPTWMRNFGFMAVGIQHRSWCLCQGFRAPSIRYTQVLLLQHLRSFRRNFCIIQQTCLGSHCPPHLYTITHVTQAHFHCPHLISPGIGCSLSYVQIVHMENPEGTYTGALTLLLEACLQLLLSDSYIISSYSFLDIICV